MNKKFERVWHGQEKGRIGGLQTLDGPGVRRKDWERFSWGGAILIALALAFFVSSCATDMGSTAHSSAGLSGPAVDYRKIEPMGNPGIWVDGCPPE